MNTLIYDGAKRKLGDEDFYCGKHLNLIAIYMKRLKDGKLSLQEAYDKIISEVIIEHVIRGSKCECSIYLHNLEQQLDNANSTDSDYKPEDKTT